MVYKKYYANLIVRIFLIVVNSLLFCYMLLNTRSIYSIVFLGILIVVQSILLMRYVNKANSILKRFLNYIAERDTTIAFPNTLREGPFKDLSNYLTKINSIIQNAKIDKENQYLFLQETFNHVNFGLIAFDENFKVILINKAANDLLGIQVVKNVHSLDYINKRFADEIIKLKPGERKIIPTFIDGKNLQLSIKSTWFKLLDRKINLVSLQDIKPELDHKEMESWQKLNRVLTHEIMNSVSPIIGLSNSVSSLFQKYSNTKSVAELNQEIINQAVQSLNIIEERSRGLNSFVNKFRSISAKITPEPEPLQILELFENLSIFMHESFEERNIKFSFSVEPENLELFVDKKLIEQVLINLLKNSSEAFGNKKEDKHVLLKAQVIENKQKTIEVIDNGEGIQKDKLDHIFTPFYTTKDSGSGIGLSLSRNILEQQGYTIDVKSIPDKKTVFTLYF